VATNLPLTDADVVGRSRERFGLPIGIENDASGSAGVRVVRELYGPEADASLLVDRARDSDEPAREALAGMGRSLGAGIASLVNVFDPELVVVGGGFGAAAGDSSSSPPAGRSGERRSTPPTRTSASSPPSSVRRRA
jgi:predicted NBD/HSP70 family sugar kinase